MIIYLCCGDKTGLQEPSVGIDIKPPCDVLQDVRTMDGRRFRNADLIFATPPCDGFTDLPWRPATGEGLDVLLACWRICHEAGVPWLLENSRFAQRYLGPALCHRDGHYFWGTVMPSEFHHVKGRTSGRHPEVRAHLPSFTYGVLNVNEKKTAAHEHGLDASMR